MAILKGGIPISTLEQWERLGGPKRADHWREGRSAMETARAWLAAGERMPGEVVAALESEFGAIRTWQGEPEVCLPFDGFSGEPRNSDLVVDVTDDQGSYLLAVEAKADEEFGETTATTLADAMDRLLQNPRSNGVRRVQQLATAIIGPRQKKEVALKDIRYQLLTATAGAICEAERRQVGRVVLLIQEFVTDKTDDSKHLANAVDLDRFVHRASHGSVATVPCGRIVGPLVLPGQPLFSSAPRFYVGKVSRNIRTR